MKIKRRVAVKGEQSPPPPMNGGEGGEIPIKL
jgi:hypothetical protein